MYLPKLFPTGTSYVRIPQHKLAAMRVLLETVQRGSQFWIGGLISADKALGFATKMAERYRTDASQGQRAYAKSKGIANSSLVMFPDSPPHLRYWLLATPGSGAVHEQERLQNSHLRREALYWGEQYRLEHVQRPREHGGGRTWTWSLTEQRYAELEASMIQYASAPGRVAERRDDLDALVRAILRMPGFYGIRQQQMQLLQLGQQRWNQTHGSETYAWPERVSYVDKHFNCYHVPEPLRLDVLVMMMQRRGEVGDLSPGAGIHLTEDVLHSKSQSSLG